MAMSDIIVSHIDTAATHPAFADLSFNPIEEVGYAFIPVQGT
ncbi:hypothetical protein [Alteromonas pelagimontana]|nr:hypothetical protein [Alteromonas pelagimontana]